MLKLSLRRARRFFCLSAGAVFLTAFFFFLFFRLPPSPARSPLALRQQAENDEIYFELRSEALFQKKRGFVSMASINEVRHAACRVWHVACQCSNFGSAKYTAALE